MFISILSFSSTCESCWCPSSLCRSRPLVNPDDVHPHFVVFVNMWIPMISIFTRLFSSTYESCDVHLHPVVLVNLWILMMFISTLSFSSTYESWWCSSPLCRSRQLMNPDVHLHSVVLVNLWILMFISTLSFSSTYESWCSSPLCRSRQLMNPDVHLHSVVLVNLRILMMSIFTVSFSSTYESWRCPSPLLFSSTFECIQHVNSLRFESGNFSVFQTH